MIYFIIGIVILNIIAIYIIKDTNAYLKFNSIITIAAGYGIIIFNYILRNIINNKIIMINISKVTNIIYKKAVDRGLIIILVGGIKLIIYVINEYRKRNLIKVVN